MVRYRVTWTRTATTTEAPDMFAPGEIVWCARRNEAIDMAKELSADPLNCMIEAWQIGADGGDPAIATAAIWRPGMEAA